MKTLPFITLATIAPALLVVAPAPFASAAHIDMLLFRQGNSLRLAGYDFGGNPPVLTDYRVFAGSLERIEAAPGLVFGDTPGWNALSLANQLPSGASTLPGRGVVSVRGRVLPSAFGGVNLAHWSGVGPIRFTAPAGGEVMEHAYGPGVVVHDASTSSTGWLSLGSTSSAGGMHRHPSFEIYGNAARDPLGADRPADGVYLFALSASMASLEESNVAFVVLGVGVDATTLEQARRHVELIVPGAPSLSLLFAITALSAPRRRRA